MVVSERGDILSPKYDPEMIAPATMGKGTPKPRPTPIKAIPTVPAVDQELPVASETVAQIRHVANRKILGDNISRVLNLAVG